jgi:hypothetical protein
MSVTQVMSTALDYALRQRHCLLEGLAQANACSDDTQVAQLEYALETLDGLLTMVTCNEARH